MNVPAQKQVLILALVFMIGMISTTLPTPLYPLYQEAFGFDLMTSMIVFAVYGTGVLLTLLLFGNLSDQLGRRPVMMLGIGCAATSALCFVIAHGLSMLLFARFLSGISAGLFTATATAFIFELAPPHWQRFAALATTLANMLGLGLGPVLTGVVSTCLPAPLTTIYLVDIALLILCFVYVWRTPETRPRTGTLRLEVRKPYVPHEIRALFVPAAIAGFAGFAVMGLFNAAVPGVVIQQMGIHDRIVIGLIVLTIFIGSGVGQGTQHLFPAHYRLPVGCLLLAIGMVTLGISIYNAQLVMLIVGAIVAGIGQGTAFRAGLGAITQQSPAEHRAGAAAMFFIITYIAISLPVVGLGLAAQVLGIGLAGALFSGIIAVLALVAMVVILKVHWRTR